MRLRIVLLLTLTALLLAACGSAKADDGRLRVVAAENAYGSIAAQIGGDHVSVTSLLSSPNADPHLFEASTADDLAVATAGVVIQNGLGYDAFMTRLENAAPSRSRLVVTMANVLGIRSADANPHLWYDIPQLGRIAKAIADALAQADPSHAAAYREGLHRFERSLGPLRSELARIRERFRGDPVAYTEPVPGYLVAAAGLRNLAPAAFTRAIEDGSEPSPAGVSAMLALVAKHRIRVLLYNEQTVSPVTQDVTRAAVATGIPVVPVTETLPSRRTFQRWQLGQAKQLARALAR